MLALVVDPGTPDSARVEEVPATEAREGEVLLRTLEVGVCGTDREIAEAIAYLASDAAAFVTGSVLVIDGGLTAA